MITLSFSPPNIVANVISSPKAIDPKVDFNSSCAILRNQKFTFDKPNKVWKKSAALYNNDLYDILRMVTDVYFPGEVKQQIINYPKQLPSELIVEPEIQKINYRELLKEPYEPFKGKPPFENYQDEDIRRALRQNRFLFNWTMGLGKSFATAVIYEYLRTYKNVPKLILVTSRIGTNNLQEELDKFCLHLSLDDVAVFNSPKAFRKYSRLIFDNLEVCSKKVLVFSYDSWKLVAKAYGDKPRARSLNIPLNNFFEEGTDWLLCLDECHYLSNPKSERSKSLFKYLGKFKYRYLFSATPADKYQKLYSVLLLLDPKLCFYLKYGEWLNKYNDVGTWYSKYAINNKKWHMEEIQQINTELSKYSAKRNSKDCLNLPPLFTKSYEIEMSEKHRALYKTVTNDIVNNCLKKNPDLDSASVDIIKEAFSTVMSLCENPKVLATSQTDLVSDRCKKLCDEYNYAKDYAKLDLVDAILEDEFEREQRGILWYIHPKTKDVLLERYESYHPIIISADLSEDERTKALKEFKSDPKHKVLIASQNILSTSVTITECSFAIYLETAFAYETYYQSTGRIYRIGQEKEVRLYHIWLKDSTDLFHINALDRKGDIVNTLFSATDKPRLTAEQLHNLFLGIL